MGYEASIHYYDTLDRQIRYVEIGDDSKPMLLFIHGAPASVSFWLNYMTHPDLLSRFKIVAVDRPGYGGSGYGESEPSVKKQAKLVSRLLKMKQKIHDKIIVQGSSYGGTLAARLAMDYPQLIDGLILLSASVCPKEEKIYSITYPTSAVPLKWMIPKALRMANEEKLGHKAALDAMLPSWKNIVAPTIIMHGTDDSLIYPINASFAKEKITNAPRVELHWAEGRGHDLSWTRKDLILESLEKMLGWVTEIALEKPL